MRGTSGQMEVKSPRKTCMTKQEHRLIHRKFKRNAKKIRMRDKTMKKEEAIKRRK
jgi:hypothetical protein